MAKYRVRVSGRLNHNGRLMDAGEEVELTPQQAGDAAVIGLVEPAERPPQAAPQPAPTAPAEKQASAAKAADKE